MRIIAHFYCLCIQYTITMLSTSDDQTPECPLCLEQLEMDDINFFPCTCGYQICRFCWHRIRTDENGLCPACRKQYPEDPANFKPLTAEEMQRIKNEKRQKDLQRKQKISENRKHLANVRVVQKNLVFVVGLPSRLADPEALKKHDYFGKFGKIVKVIVNHSTSYAGSQGPSASAYVTYQKAEDALKAIQAVNNSKVDGRTLKASLGTTKYCSNFLKKQQCPKPDCMYLHELGDEAASFTKEEMQLGKHQEYEHKLYEQMVHNNNLNRKQLSPAEHIDSSQFVQKERWPSPSKKEDHRMNGILENEGYSQSVQNNSKTIDSSTFKSKHNNDATAGCPEERLSERDAQQLLKSQFRRNIVREEYPNSDAEHQNVNCLSSEPNRHLSLMNSSFSCSSNSGFKNVNFVSNAHKTQTQSFDNATTSEKSDLMRQKSQQSTSNVELAKSPFPLQQSRPKSPVSHAGSLPNGMSLGSNSVVLNSVQMSQDWINAHPREYYKHKLSEIPQNSSSDPAAYTLNHHEDNSNNSVFNTGRNTLYDVQHFQYSSLSSGHEDSNQPCYPLSSVDNCVNSSDSTGENSVNEEQDDELDFDPWHESSKGLADLMIKEAGEKARVNYAFLHRPSMNSLRRSVMPLETMPVQNRLVENSHSGPRPVVPPPGFHLNNYGANTSMPRPTFGADAFTSKMLPVMNTYNHSPTSAPLTQYQQVLHPSVGLANNVLHMSETGMRPHPREWQENISNLPQNTVDHSFGPLVQQQQHHQQQQHMPVLGRASHPSWNNSVPTDFQWLSQGQAPLNQGFIENRANSPSHILKMLQQLKMNEHSVRVQNHLKYTIPSSYRGSLVNSDED